jgi:hypothetical protein
MTRRRHRAVAVLAAAAVVGLVGAQPAGAAHRRASLDHVCVVRTTVMDTPRGLAVGFLTRGTPVAVVRRSDNRYWTDMRAPESLFGWIAGWIHTKDLC